MQMMDDKYKPKKKGLNMEKVVYLFSKDRNVNEFCCMEALSTLGGQGSGLHN